MTNLVSKKVLLSLATITALSLTSCGGGGSSTIASVNTSDKNDTVNGKAIDGYLVKSTVCLDLNMNNYCEIDKGEPVTSTDENGSFTLTITPENKKDGNFTKAPLLVYGGYDSDNGPAVPFSGKLKAVRDGSSINITPTTTIVEKMVREQHLTKGEAEKSVREMLGLDDKIDLGGDPIKLAKDGKKDLLNANLRLHKNIEVLAKKIDKVDNSVKELKDLIDDLYGKLAEKYQEEHKKEPTKKLKLDTVLERVVDNHDAFTDDIRKQAKLGIKALNKRIDNFDYDDLDNLDDLSLQINRVGDVIIDGTLSIDEDDNLIFKDENGNFIDDTFFDDFALMHTLDILDLINYHKSNRSEIADEIVYIFKKAGMKDDKYLPVEKEIELLKGSDNPTIKNIGRKFAMQVEMVFAPSEEIEEYFNDNSTNSDDSINLLPLNDNSTHSDQASSKLPKTKNSILAGKRLFYTKGVSINSIYFNKELSSMESQEIIGGDNCYTTSDLKLNGNEILLNDIDRGCDNFTNQSMNYFDDLYNDGKIQVIDKNKDYISVKFQNEELKLYFDKRKVEEMYHAIPQNVLNKSKLPKLLAGKTLYSDDEVMTFSPNATSLKWKEVDYYTGKECYGSGNITFEDDIISYTANRDSCYPEEIGGIDTITVLEKTSDYIKVKEEDGETEKYFFSRKLLNEYMNQHKDILHSPNDVKNKDGEDIPGDVKNKDGEDVQNDVKTKYDKNIPGDVKNKDDKDFQDDGIDTEDDGKDIQDADVDAEDDDTGVQDDDVDSEDTEDLQKK
jgi:hypothetical protein